MINLNGDHDQRKNDSEDNEEVANLEHGLLRVTDRPGAGYQFGRPPKEVLVPVPMTTLPSRLA